MFDIFIPFFPLAQALRYFDVYIWNTAKSNKIEQYSFTIMRLTPSVGGFLPSIIFLTWTACVFAKSDITTGFFAARTVLNNLYFFCFQEGIPIYLIWAYHLTSDVQPGQFVKHTFRGSTLVNVIPAATLTPTARPTTTPSEFNAFL